MSDPRLRVALVAPMIFGDDGLLGGAERHTVELARALARLTDVWIVTTGPRRTTRSIDGVVRVEVHPHRALLGGTRTNPLSIGFLRSLLDADVIHCASYSTVLTDLSVLAGRALRKRVFVTDHGGGSYISLTRALDVSRLCHGVLAVSSFSAQRVGRGRARTRVIYGGVDVDRFRPAAERPRSGVVFVGRLLPHKGVDGLIEALPDGTRLTVLGRSGDPAYLGLLQGLAAGRSVTFCDNATDDDIVDAYRSASVAVLPSVYDDCCGGHTDVPELLGLSLLEAMSCATAVICTDVGGMPEVVEDGVSGFVVPPGDLQALSARIGQLQGDPALSASMGAAGRRRVEAMFTWSAVAERCLAAYREAGAA